MPLRPRLGCFLGLRRVERGNHRMMLLVKGSAIPLGVEETPRDMGVGSAALRRWRARWCFDAGVLVGVAR